MKFDEHLKKERTGHLENISNMDYEFFFFCHLNWSILTLSQKWVKLLKYSGLYNQPLLAACIIGLYYRPASDIRGRIYNSFVGGIIVQMNIQNFFVKC